MLDMGCVCLFGLSTIGCGLGYLTCFEKWVGYKFTCVIRVNPTYFDQLNLFATLT